MSSACHPSGKSSHPEMKRSMIMAKKVDLENVTVKGDFGQRLMKSIENLLALKTKPELLRYWKDTADYIWGADFLGRWLEVMSILSEHTGDGRYGLENVFEQLQKCQRPDGSFHPQTNIYTVYGGKSGIRGLVAYYRCSGDMRALAVAEKAADWFYRKYLGKKPAQSRYRSIYFTSSLDALVELYEITGKDKYLKISRWFGDLAAWETENPGQTHHSATVFSKIKALVNLYEIAGEKEYLNTAVRMWDNTASNVLWLTGGTPETFGNTDTDEVCGSADWIRLSLALWRITHDIKYMDTVERTLLNHIYFTQLPTGGNSGTCDIDQGFRHKEAWFCCSMNCPLAFSMLLKYMVATTKGTIWVNLFLDSQVKVDLDSRTRVILKQKTKYPEKGEVKLTVNPDTRKRFKIKVRIPGSADLSSVTVNGRTVPCKRQKGYLLLDRTWKKGDTIELRMLLKMSVETSDIGKGPTRRGTVKIGNDLVRTKRMAIFYGPLALAIFRTGHGNDLSWVYRGGYNEVLDSGGCYTRYDTSCSDYVKTNLIDFASERAPHLTEVVIHRDPEVAHLRWHYDLKGVGRISYEVNVLSGLPVTLEYRETIVVRASGKKPVKLRRMLLSGVRFSTEKVQARSFYKDDPAYSYPEAKVRVNHKYFTPRNEQVLRKTGEYELDNGLFQARCSYRGAVEEVMAVRNKNGVGVYLSPIPGQGLEIRMDTEFEIVRKIIFPIRKDRCLPHSG